MERTFVMVKPDGVQRGLAGEIIGRLEKRGLKPVALKLMQIPAELAEQHYAEHKARPFFPELIRFITSGPVVAMVWEGPKVISTVRTTMGVTDPAQAAPGTIRGDLAVEISSNVVHGSADAEAAAREIELFFGAGGQVEYTRAIDQWVFAAKK